MKVWKLIYSDLCYSVGGRKSFIGMVFSFFFNASFQVLCIYRISHALRKTKFRRLTIPLSWWQNVMYSCVISPFAKIGTNLMLPHPLGIVIGSVEIGNNVKIWQQVTLGSHGKPNKPLGYPIVEDNVKIFAGAKVFGNINIGENSSIGANAVVNIDVPQDSIAIGIPATIKNKNRT